MSGFMTPASTLALADGFVPPSREVWLAAVDDVLKGAPFDKKLVQRTYDGIAIQPLYTRDDVDPAADPAGLPGQGRLARGNKATPEPWVIAQIRAESDPAEANRCLLHDLERGVSGIVLQAADHGGPGVVLRDARDLEQVLHGVFLDMVPLVLDAGSHTPELAGWLVDLLRAQDLTADQVSGSLGYDPLSDWARLGGLHRPLRESLAALPRLRDLVAPWPALRVVEVDGHATHAAGGSEAQEIAAILGAVVAYLRAYEEAGVAPAEAARTVSVQVAADADLFLTMAKLRALRVVLSRLLEAAGVAPEHCAVPVRARTAQRMLTRYDPWVNMLRTTVACFAAGVAGADMVSVEPFDAALGVPDSLGRRVARNIQIILQEESGLARVLDPAGGSFYVESLTRDLAQAAWSLFQEVEAGGGLVEALRAGAWQDRVAQTAAARTKAVAKRKDGITGVSMFPNLGETLPAREAWPDAQVPQRLADPVTPLAAFNAAASFEALRDGAAGRTDAKVFLATLGTLAQSTARVSFVRNLLAAGGLAAEEGPGGEDTAAITAAFTSSGCTVAVLCGPDDLYEGHAATLAEALKSAGARSVLLAGRFGDQEDAWRAAGIDGAVGVGSDVVAALRGVHRTLGLGGEAA